MTVLGVSVNVMARILERVKEDKNAVIAIARTKPVNRISKGDIIRIRPNHLLPNLPSINAEVVDIKEITRPDELPYNDLEPIYKEYIYKFVKSPYVAVIYVKPVSFY
ncbi:MAG: hypothetical protein JHC26_05190 [Thermofilum sp.]|uniref:hypothetical protein n=1 Tax=Thermofilum sp. TaxID=1961369 RepID=UPI002588A88D|nr:hypothetical protein [Thermofilum sp.]MCI4408465.1 hypothetical protein [Thermofilum sp.]